MWAPLSSVLLRYSQCPFLQQLLEMGELMPEARDSGCHEAGLLGGQWGEAEKRISSAFPVPPLPPLTLLTLCSSAPGFDLGCN